MTYVAFILLGVAFSIVALRVANPLPDIVGRAEEKLIPAALTTTLGRLMIEAQVVGGAGLSGVVSLDNGEDALSSRLAAIDSAEVSIDAQYYIWRDDVSGMLLLDALDRAAKRGVRVRLLLDDNGVPDMDQLLATLDAHEHLSIRLFNPSTIRAPKLMGFAIDFFRMNRRMHNKALIVDGAVAIIGGRNIGDEYFQLSDAQFIDMDAIAFGTVVAQTARIFDNYWNSKSVFAAQTIISGTGDRTAYEARVRAVKRSRLAGEVTDRLSRTYEQAVKGMDELEWVKVEVYADDPVKGLGMAKDEQLLISHLGEILGNVETKLHLASAYFIPSNAGTAFFSNLSASGRDIHILTNSMDTTDVFLVHAGYVRYRRAILEGGVHLYELKPSQTSEDGKDQQILPFGLSGASLHAKTFAIDDKRVFIGSFNFDPRSAALNCEMGFLIESPSLARRVVKNFEGPMRYASFVPKLTQDGKMIWEEPKQGGEPVIFTKEPGASWIKQFTLKVVGILPVEWLL